MIYDPFPTGERCCTLPSDKLYKKNLRPSFKFGRTSIGVFACIVRRSRSRQVFDQGTQKACLHFKISICKCVK
jgi:hypothetical protein